MLVKSAQPANALSPIYVTLLGIVMLIKLSQSENIPDSMLVKFSGITIFLD